MSMEQVTEKPKRTISPELKVKMAAGRTRAAAARKAKPAKSAKREHKAPVAAPKSDVPAEFVGLTEKDCSIGCTPERCAIGGSLVFKNDDGTKSLVGHCTHPFKTGLGPLHKINPEIVERFNRAVAHLEHAKIERRKDR